MKLDELIRTAKLRPVARGGEGDPELIDIACDSRNVKPGFCFVAIPGTKVHGDTFIPDAVARGAVAVVSENAQPACTVPWIEIAHTRGALGLLGRGLWKIDPASVLFAAITGTNGKTTTAHLLEKLFAHHYGAERAWMYGTIEYHTGATRVPASHTTPEALTIFRAIGAAPVKPRAVVMEVSSHSLALDRVGGLEFDLAIWTNLTQDHLDFHHTMEEYYAAKKRLYTEYLKESGICVINIDDPWGKKLASELQGRTLVTYGRAPDAAVRIDTWQCDWDGCRIGLVANGRSISFASPLRGFFNVYNLTAAYAAAHAVSIDVASIDTAFRSIETVPGRMDRVAIDAPFAVVVDYAHTPDALVNVLATARPLTRGRLLCVFGCGGDRDRSKRPLMGAEVARLCDEAVVTSDNPRTEKPESIIEEILKGIPLDFPHRVITDRRAAIGEALSLARKGDCVVIAGKGHEDYQEINGVKHHFNDKETVVELYRRSGSPV